ncbi:MAG: TetR/AcrR family transcriptional regulator [Treponema sp.]|nr:TetR/AcrR family transcriptional regulator [Treponema sp.]
MGKKNISQEKIIQAFLTSAFAKSAGASSLADVSEILEIKKASLYNHFDSRDDMYAATLVHCAKEVENVSFLQEKTIETIKGGKVAPSALFKKLITRFFELFENEPFFAIYVFVHTEQYFNIEALKIVEAENQKIFDSIKELLSEFSAAGKIAKRTDKELKDIAAVISGIIIQHRDSYIAARKEIVRQNPDCGAGSLFALPTDETALNRTLKLVDSILKTL